MRWRWDHSTSARRRQEHSVSYTHLSKIFPWSGYNSFFFATALYSENQMHALSLIYIIPLHHTPQHLLGLLIKFQHLTKKCTEQRAKVFIIQNQIITKVGLKYQKYLTLVISLKNLLCTSVLFPMLFLGSSLFNSKLNTICDSHFISPQFKNSNQ